MSQFECDDHECECACHGYEANDDGPDFPLPRDAIVFETTNDSAFPRGAIVQLVGFGPAQKEDDPDQTDGPFIWAQAVRLEDADCSIDPEGYPESWRYFRDDLRPLTPAARSVANLLLKHHRAFERKAGLR